LRPSLKGSDDGIMIRQYPRGLFQQHRPKADMEVICGSPLLPTNSEHFRIVQGRSLALVIR
jgi:hypothetical protein